VRKSETTDRHWRRRVKMEDGGKRRGKPRIDTDEHRWIREEKSERGMRK